MPLARKAVSKNRFRPLHWMQTRGLLSLLGALGNAHTPAARLAALEKLARWLRGDVTLESRVTFVLEALEQDANLGSQVSRTLALILEEHSAMRLLSRTGLPSEAGLFSELVERISSRFLPRRVHRLDLTEVLHLLFSTEKEARALERLSGQTFGRILQVLAQGGSNWKSKVRVAAENALLLLSSDLRSLALSEAVYERCPEGDIRESAFVRLSGECESLARGTGDGGRCLSEVARCRATHRALLRRLEHGGVSLRLVYNAEMMRRLLERIEVLLKIMQPAFSEEKEQELLRLQIFVGDLIRGACSDQSIRSLLSGGFGLIALKIVEYSGTQGKNYITRNRQDYWHMVVGAGGGGVLTAFTAWAKFLLSWAKLPILIHAALSSVNYAGSFLVMQLLGFKLATKQPSMTASALAAQIKVILDAGQERARISTGLIEAPFGHVSDRAETFADEVAQITRSQLAAAFGNLLLVVPTVFAINAFMVWSRGLSVLDETTAQYAIHSLHPTESFTLPFAFLTGCILWVSSLSSGWVANWITFREVGPALMESRRARRWLGERGARRFSHAVVRAFPTAVGNISLGVMLALPSILGQGLGIPLDVRHVTLSTGSLAFGVASLGLHRSLEAGAGPALLGILCIGLLNFGVSFALALTVAFRARAIGLDWMFTLVRSIVWKLLRRPQDFLWPPKSRV